MVLTLRIFFIACILIFLGIILHYLKQRRLNLKYTLVWLLCALAMLFFAIFPDIVGKLGALVGIATPTSTVFVFFNMFSLLIILTLTVIVSHLNNRVYRLTQAQALLERRLRELEEKETLETK